MGTNDIRQIRVGTDRIGIIGLKMALEELSPLAGSMTEEQIKKHLVETLGKKNYISPNARERYEKAFYREFCLFSGKPVEEDRTAGVIEIKVLGQGCGRCDQLTRDVITLVSEMQIPADVEHVRDIKAIAGYGVLGSPGLVIDGDVKSVGTVPGRAKIMAWLSEAAENRKTK